MSRLTSRLSRAVRLDPYLFEEVEADTTSLKQATVVVVLSSIAAGIGSGVGIIPFFAGTVSALIGWYVWAYLTYFIGTRFFPEPQTKADYGELLRTIGFAAAPGIARAFGFVPLFGPTIFFIASFWMLVAMVMAVKQALDYKSTGRAIGVCVLGWIIQGVLSALVLWML